MASVDMNEIPPTVNPAREVARSILVSLTRLAGELKFAGDRVQADQQASSLLELVA